MTGGLGGIEGFEGMIDVGIFSSGKKVRKIGESKEIRVAKMAFGSGI